MKRIVETFVELGARLDRGIDAAVVERAHTQNEWFMADEILFAAHAISTQMLRREVLEAWLESYGEVVASGERVLIVMAGNIPLVSFFDLLCVVASGGVALVKPSHKDRLLMEWVVDELRDIDRDIPIYIYEEGEPLDRVIATGGDAAIQHFAELYRDTPTLLRGSRHSVAVVVDGAGREGLLRDIYCYSGLGCRNVSMIFVPRGYDLALLPTPSAADVNAKYRNNYLQNRALLTLSGQQFYDTGHSCLVRQDHFPLRLTTISIVEYVAIEEVERWIAEHDNELQCIVADGATLDHPRRVEFGEAQCPTLYDYADGVDTMKFLRDNKYTYDTKI